MNENERFEITHSVEYKAYIEALCHLASKYVPKIRRQFAAKSVELFQNETIRRLVLAYGEEAKKEERELLQEFTWAANSPESGLYSLETSCLNNAAHYAEAIKLFFLEK